MIVNPPTVLLISYHFHPSNEIGARRPTALARFLVSKGVRVVVVSAFEGKDVAPGAEVLPGVIAIPVRKPAKVFIDAIVSLKANAARTSGSFDAKTSSTAAPATRASWKPVASGLRNRFFRVAYFIDEYKKWSWRASRAAVRAGKMYHARVVLASSPPHSALLCGACSARSLGVPYIADLRDPWTDAPASSAHPARKFELKLLRALEGWVMHSAVAVTSTGATVADLLSNRYPEVREKVHVIRNGYDGDLQRNPSETGGRLAILFAGELYVGRDPFPLLTALENLLHRGDIVAERIRVTFVGKVTEYRGQSVADWLRGKRCESVVRLLPSMPQPAIAELARESTVLLNLAQRQGLSVPAKTFEHLASGRENLLVSENESETSRLVRGIPGVTQVDGSPASLERALLDLYRRHVLEGHLTAPAAADVAQFSRNNASQHFWTIIEEAAGLGAMSAPGDATTT